MADNIRLITYAEQTVTPMNDAILQDVGVGQNGILYGVEISASGNTISISGGYGVIKGRLFQVSSSNITVQLSSGSTLLGRLYIRLDLSNQNEPISILTETGSTLSDLTQEDDANFTDGIYEMELARFSVSTAEVADVVETFNHVHGGVSVISASETNANDYTETGIYYFSSTNAPSNLPSGVVNGWLIVIGCGAMTGIYKQILLQQGINTYTRTYTDNSWSTWKRLITEDEMYYMPNDQVTIYLYGGGYLTSGKTSITTFAPLCKPVHSSVSSVSLVSASGNTVTIRQNGAYLADAVNPSTLNASFTKRPNGIQINLTKSSGFGGTNNDSVGINMIATIKFN